MKTYRSGDHQLNNILGRLTMAERAEKLAAHLDDERKLQFYGNWAKAVINNYFVFSDGSEIEVPVK